MGAMEIDLIAQDTSSYGQDLYGERRLPALLSALGKIEMQGWMRLMYAYPRHLDQEMLDVLASNDLFCRYIDLPLQHISDAVLKSMGRGFGRDKTLDLLERIRSTLPGVAIRTTFIVGYPGETEKDFEDLLQFVQAFRFSHMGVFTYSPEPLTAAAQIEETVREDEKARRRDALMAAQLDVSRQLLSERVGEDIEIMIDGFLDPDLVDIKDVTAVGHGRFQAPEVDGVMFLTGPLPTDVVAGSIVNARVTAGLDYDLVVESAK